MSIQNLYIFGGKSTALEMAETAALVHPAASIYHVVGDQEEIERPHYFHLSQLRERVVTESGNTHFILSMANLDIRRDRLRKAEENGLIPLTLIHPKAVCSSSATLGEGCYLAAGAVVSAEGRVGSHTVVNYNVSVGHHTKIGEHCFLNPGAAIGGGTTIGNRVLVGSNAFIFQGITVGDDSQIDALTYIHENLEARCIASSRQTRIFPRIDFK